MQIDNSTLRTYTDCNVKGMLSNVLHRKPQTDGEASWFGTQFHKFPQFYWQPGDKWKQILIEFEDRYKLFIEKQAQLGKLGDSETIKPHVFLNMATQFVQQVPRVVNDQNEVILLDAQTKHPIFKVRHRPEIGFKFPIGSEGDEYIGRLDTLLEDFSGHLWIADIKTTGKYNRDKATGEAIPQFTWKQQFTLSTQFSGYIRGVQHNTNQPVAGAVIFAIPRAEKKIRVELIRVRRTEEQLEQWERMTVRLINQFKRDKHYIETYDYEGLKDIVPTGAYSGACTRFGICPYHEICKWSYAPGIIEQTTVFKPWNPLAEQEEDC